MDAQLGPRARLARPGRLPATPHHFAELFLTRDGLDQRQLLDPARRCLLRLLQEELQRPPRRNALDLAAGQRHRELRQAEPAHGVQRLADRARRAFIIELGARPEAQRQRPAPGQPAVVGHEQLLALGAGQVAAHDQARDAPVEAPVDQPGRAAQRAKVGVKAHGQQVAGRRLIPARQIDGHEADLHAVVSLVPPFRAPATRDAIASAAIPARRPRDRATR